MKTMNVYFLTTFALALLLSDSCFAQVKVGDNPGVIGGNSNFEVEGGGHTFSINKAGKLILKDGTEAANRILTWDAGNGVAEWKSLNVISQQTLLTQSNPPFGYSFSMPGSSNNYCSVPQSFNGTSSALPPCAKVIEFPKTKFNIINPTGAAPAENDVIIEPILRYNATLPQVPAPTPPETLSPVYKYAFSVIAYVDFDRDGIFTLVDQVYHLFDGEGCVNGYINYKFILEDLPAMNGYDVRIVVASMANTSPNAITLAFGTQSAQGCGRLGAQSTEKLVLTVTE